MLSYIIALFAVPALFIAWLLFQTWLARLDTGYNGYKAGCGGCSRSCGDTEKSNNNDSNCDFSKDNIEYPMNVSLISKETPTDKL